MPRSDIRSRSAAGIHPARLLLSWIRGALALGDPQGAAYRRQDVYHGRALALDGWLIQTEVAEFEKVCASGPEPLCLDLNQLVGADAQGVIALKEQRARGARIIGASPLVQLLLDRAAGP
jgi:hypothetical protein